MKQRTIERLRGLAAVEAIALMIALVMPLTPSKTGSDLRPGNVLFQDAGYLEHVLVGFLLVHVILLVLALAVWIVTLVSEGRSGPRR